MFSLGSIHCWLVISTGRLHIYHLYCGIQNTPTIPVKEAYVAPIHVVECDVLFMVCIGLGTGDDFGCLQKYNFVVYYGCEFGVPSLSRPDHMHIC